MHSLWWPISRCTLWPGCSFTSSRSTIWIHPSQAAWAQWTSLYSGLEKRCKRHLATLAKSALSLELSVSIYRRCPWLWWASEHCSPSYFTSAQKRVHHAQRRRVSCSLRPPQGKLCLVLYSGGNTGWRNHPSTRWLLNLCCSEFILICKVSLPLSYKELVSANFRYNLLLHLSHINVTFTYQEPLHNLMQSNTTSLP